MRNTPFTYLRDPARIDALQRIGLLHTPPEPAYDRLTRLAATLLHAPVALISLVDHDHQFFKSQIGLPEPWATQRETPLSHSFCQYVVTEQAPLIISDARQHPLVADNLAIPDLGVVAYAGMPLRAPSGEVLGAYCAIDTVPRTWLSQEIALLQDLSACVMTEIALRDSQRKLQASEDQHVTEDQLLREQMALFNQLNAPIISVMGDLLIAALLEQVGAAQVAQLQVALEQTMLETGLRTVILDISGVEQIDADLLDALTPTIQDVHYLGGLMIVAGIPDHFEYPFDRYEIDIKRTIICPNREQAIAYIMAQYGNTGSGES